MEMEKVSNSTSRLRLDTRVLLVALILLMGVYTAFSFIWSDTFNQTGGRKCQGEGRANEAAVVREWESASVKDVTEDEKVGEMEYGEAPRRFIPFGTGSFLFALFAAHRTGPGTFAVVGLGPKMMHASWNKPRFFCSWRTPSSPSPLDKNSSSEVPPTDAKLVQGSVEIRYLPDKEFPNIEEYITLVVYCTFEGPVGIGGAGGELRMVADHGEYRQHTGLQRVECAVAIEDQQSSSEYGAPRYDGPFKYEYLYCGSPIYGTVNPHRMREWLAYHMRLLGENSHFILYDAGGISSEVWRVLEPWVKLGRVTIMNVRQQARYNTYNDGQLVFANDCLLRSKTLAKWTLFFDVDEYLHVSHSAHLEVTFHQVMSEMADRGRRATSIQLQQRPMSNDHCIQNASDPTLLQKWAFEKLVYRRHVSESEGWTRLRDYKSIVQAKYVLTMGIHFAVDVEVPPELTKEDTRTQLDAQYEGCRTCLENKLHYYHYHGTTSVREELCKYFVSPLDANTEFDGAVHELDSTMSSLGDIVRKFELETIGPVHGI